MIEGLFLVFLISRVFTKQIPMFVETGANIQIFDVLRLCPGRPLDKTMVVYGQGKGSGVSGLTATCYGGYGAYVTTNVGDVNAKVIQATKFEKLFITPSQDGNGIVSLTDDSVSKSSVQISGWPYLSTFKVVQETSNDGNSKIRGMKIAAQGSGNSVTTIGYDLNKIENIDMWCPPGQYVIEFDVGYEVVGMENYMKGLKLTCSGEGQSLFYVGNNTNLMGDVHQSKNGFTAVSIKSQTLDNMISVSYATPLTSKSAATSGQQLIPEKEGGRLIGVSFFYEAGISTPFRKMVYLFEP